MAFKAPEESKNKPLTVMPCLSRWEMLCALGGCCVTSMEVLLNGKFSVYGFLWSVTNL